MNINEPERKAIYCHLSKDAKTGLDEIARYHRTTLTNLIEQGARMVIKDHLKQIHAWNVESQEIRSAHEW